VDFLCGSVFEQCEREREVGWLFHLYQWVASRTWFGISRLGHFVNISEEEIVSKVLKAEHSNLCPIGTACNSVIKEGKGLLTQKEHWSRDFSC
jgi:hypothetical protein